VASPYRIVIWQVWSTLVAAAGLSVWDLLLGGGGGWDWNAPLYGVPQTVSALAAGLACVVPAWLYAWRATVERSATRFLLQGVLKFGLTLTLMAVCIVAIKPAAAGFFGTFILLQAMYVIAPLTDGAGGLPRG
jgi:hypothetical protein